jgi:Subtilase family
MQRPAVWMTVAVLGAIVAVPAGAPARSPDTAVAAACSKETKRLKTFQRGMKAAKRRFFRTHPGAKARKRFVTKQRRKLAALKRARRRCLAVPPGPPAPPPAPLPSPPPPEPPARGSIADVFSPAATFSPGEVSTEDGVEYVRTQLELELAAGATAPEMRALLDRLGAEVVSSLAGVGLLTVRIPDPGSLAAARAVVAGLAGAPGLAHAEVATVPVTTELPDIVTLSDLSPVRPQITSRAHGAWNARGGLVGVTPPTLVINDYFGAGPPGAEVAVQETAADFATVNPVAHGYTMLGLAAGAFEPGAVANLQADQVTGMWAGPDLPLRVVDLSRSIANSTMEDRLLLLVSALSGDVIVSTSLADGCALVGCTDAQLQRDASQWITRVRGSGLEGRFLHVSAAGNIYPNLLTDTAAARGSAVNAAALLPLAGVANLTNTIVVEDTTSSHPAAGPPVPICLTATSKRGGHISAVGNDIKSLSAPGVPRDLPQGGTSSAAPQVAGAAAAVWALAPALSPADVAGLLRATARPVTTVGGDVRCGTAAAAPALDAYAAVLAADGVTRERARSAILDADGDGTFDEQDLAAFRDAFVASAADGVADLDYGRFDLNGDGYTGGGRDRVDLDARSPVQWTFSRRREVLGLEVLHDENAVRDLDVLCHEAHGPNYAGDTTARDVFAEEFCLPPVELVADPVFPATLQPGQTHPLRILARRTDLTDPAVSHQPGVHLDFAQTSGVLGATTGTTGQDGAFTTDASLGPSGGLDVEVTARAGAGGPPLDTVRITAAPGSGPITFMEGSTFLVANAEGDDDVKDNEDVNYSDSVSAADKDATAFATLTSALDLSDGGFSFTGQASATATDDGGGGDASAFLVRRFVVTQDMFFHLKASLHGADPEDTAGQVSLGLTGSPNPGYHRTTFGSDDFGGFFSPGDYTLTAEVGCSPRGGTCAGDWSFELQGFPP